MAEKIPLLRCAKIEIIEHVANGSTRYIKRVAERSPALFVIPCGDAKCQDGGHDITAELMHWLHQRLLTASGEHRCAGMTGSAECLRRIQFTLTAEYARDEPHR